MQLVLILDNIRSVYNTASLFRTADCFGVNLILLCGTTPAPVDRFGRKRADFAKVALGAEDTVPFRYFKTTAQACAYAYELGYVVMAIEQHESSRMLPDVVPVDAANYALVLGNEVTGVHIDVISLCDSVLEIPQWGTKESLNVCNAGAIALYHFRTR